MDTSHPHRQARLALVATVVFEALAAATLVALGRAPGARIDTADLGRWLGTTPLVDVSFALLRVVGLVLVTYLLATTIAYVTARLSHVPTFARAVAPFTLPAMRRVADRAVAGTLVTSTLVGGLPASAAVALEVPPTASVTASGAVLPPGVRAPSQTTDTGAGSADPAAPIPTPRRAAVPTPRTPEGATPTDDATATATGGAPLDAIRDAAPMPGTPIPHPAPDARTVGPSPGDERAPVASGEIPDATLTDGSTSAGDWVAARGDSLWHIAEHVVAEADGIDVAETADRDVAAYWQTLVAANRGSLASGDIDVVAIGERIALPPLDAD